MTGGAERILLTSLKEQAAAALRERIFSGAAEDGQELTQADIAASLGVSRIPVRDALFLLEGEGLVERLPNRHVRVVGLTAGRLRQNFSVLAALEAELAALALPALQGALPDETDDAALRRLNAQILSAMAESPERLRRAIRGYYAACAEHVRKELAL